MGEMPAIKVLESLGYITRFLHLRLSKQYELSSSMCSVRQVGLLHVSAKGIKALQLDEGRIFSLEKFNDEGE